MQKSNEVKNIQRDRKKACNKERKKKKYKDKYKMKGGKKHINYQKNQVKGGEVKMKQTNNKEK
jgi:hypothetical protein